MSSKKKAKKNASTMSIADAVFGLPVVDDEGNEVDTKTDEPTVEVKGPPPWTVGMNEEQAAAIAHTDGPCRVLAQAGSGKTRALVNRVARMVADGIPGRDILAVTFSKKAADEMNERLKRLGIDSASVGTWHSLCLRILKEDEHPVAEWEVDDSRVKYFLKEIVGFKRMNWQGVDFGRLQSFLTHAKAGLLLPDDPRTMELARTKFGGQAALAIRAYSELQDRLSNAGILPFDDFMIHTWQHLLNEENRHTWGGRWRYLLQDEAQDANVAQKTIAEMLARDHRNYMVVGDSAQAIYSFRGSTPEHLVNFDQEWPGTKTIVMNRNYRSGSKIVEVANDIIRNAKIRLPTDMIASRADAGEGKVEIIAAANLDDEAAQFGAFVEQHSDLGGNLSDITTIFRTHAQSRALEEELLRRRIPYVVVGGVSFYDRREVKDLLAYVRVALDLDNEGDAVKRCINAPFRFLGAAFVDKLQEKAELVASPNWQELVLKVAGGVGIQARQVTSAKDWVGIIETIKRMATADGTRKAEKPDAILNWIINTTHYIRYVEKENGAESLESSTAANVRELVRVAGRFATVEELLKYIEHNQKAASKQRRDGAAGGERVLLMSIHKSKGLEWPIVWVSGCNENVLPHIAAIIHNDVEEERRLMYVAVTRARDHLILSYVRELATRAGTREAAPSRFLMDIRNEDLRMVIDGPAQMPSDPAGVAIPIAKVEPAGVASPSLGRGSEGSAEAQMGERDV